MKAVLKHHVVTTVLQRLRVVIAQNVKTIVQRAAIHVASVIAMLVAALHVVHVALHN